MAVLIPRLGAARFDSGGEQRFAERLGEKLEDNALVWHNVPIGPRDLQQEQLARSMAKGIGSSAASPGRARRCC